jgi:pimeloyl-ACP methyl ester carboxylesterase
VRALLLCGTALAIALGTPFMFEPLVDRILFQPSPGVDLHPRSLGIEAQELELLADDGVKLHAFFLPGSPPGERAILFLHGNAGNASHRLPNAAALARLGADVLLLDYRGYGLSEGRPSRAGVVADARAALAHLTGARGYDPERVVIFGRSLGAAVALAVAVDAPPGGLILESAFTSLRDMARSLAGPLGGLLVRGGFDSQAKIAQVRAPLLFFHGDRDQIVPFELGRRLYAAAPGPKVFQVIQGAGHNDTFEVGGASYLERIARFLYEVAP